VLSLWLELTPQCNLKCLFCYNDWRHQSPRQMPAPHGADWWIRQLGRLVPKYHFDYVALSGGEPLLFPGLEEVVGYLCDERQRPILTSNGIPFRENRAESLYEAGLRELQVTLHSANPAIHNELVGKDAWEGAVRALIVAHEYQIRTAVTFVRTNINSSELPAMVELLAALGVPKLIVNDMQVVGYARRNLAVIRPEEGAGQLNHRAGEKALGEAAGVEIAHIPAYSARPSAVSPWHRLAVSPDGTLKICNLSVRGIGKLTQLSDPELEAVVAHMNDGDIGVFSSAVDSCGCFERRVGLAGA
jgi:MoaA/NifB/PqqE/SkfB family radical SAM enzyme